MLVHDYKDSKRLAGKRVIALGFFDGVHKGHREILSAARCEADRLSLPCSVFTFRSEGADFKGDKIYSTENKLLLLESIGIDEVILADFEKLKEISAEDFVERILIAELGCKTALCGEDFRFGKGALGGVSLLKEISKRLGFGLIIQGEVQADGEKISSSRIKKLLSEGNVKKAAELMGEPFFSVGEVKRGLGLGKSFGFPTVNTEIEGGEVSLLSGVYKCSCEMGGKTYNALTNVGVCPTVGDREKHMETYILDCNEELYGKKIKIKFLDFVRKEKKFESAEQLIMQIKLDINKTFGSEK